LGARPLGVLLGVVGLLWGIWVDGGAPEAGMVVEDEAAEEAEVEDEDREETAS